MADFDEMRYDGAVFSSVEPKQVGNTRRRSDRTAGRQLQIILTKASSTLQYAVATLSSKASLISIEIIRLR